MTLLNDPASFPSPMWIVARYLAVNPGRPHSRDSLRAVLAPGSLLPVNKRGTDSTFDSAVRSLEDLGVVRVEADDVSLSEIGASLRPDDFATFSDLLRRQVLEPTRNAAIADSGDQSGPKDLVRALSWFLTLDPLVTMSHDDVVQRQRGALAEHLGNPFVNDVRWIRFTYWASALGLAAPPLLPPAGRAQTLVPDCAAAVFRTVRAKWPPGTRLAAREAVAGIVDELPVLPGGRYSLALGLPNEAADVSATLSFALLCGDEYGWLKLDRRSDADDEVLLVDPDRSNRTLRITHVEVQEAADG
ncbi:hypothetical protein GA0070558_15118 [Micromonospora haikouensis]|uniref:Uncharacterized protein n=1 Tax=Micromonospora haikouensis TaxID=686309 RepID=A0A1C4YK09_9ACTN|nr:protein DpdG [Micromonospora haikouensis]SCF20986.1 hypothetical protein GA0070558_15118 [Micromonospora haikouensis]